MMGGGGEPGKNAQRSREGQRDRVPEKCGQREEDRDPEEGEKTWEGGNRDQRVGTDRKRKGRKRKGSGGVRRQRRGKRHREGGQITRVMGTDPDEWAEIQKVGK